MAARNKNRGKNRKKTPVLKTDADVIREARRLFHRNDARATLAVLKRLPAGKNESLDSALLRFCAFTRRAREFDRQGQKREATLMRSRAAEHHGAVRADHLGEEDLHLYLKHLEGSDAIAAYAASGQSGASNSDIERCLADQLVIHRCWDALAALDENTALKRDADDVIGSVEAMDRGDWHSCTEKLRRLPPQSPYRAWSLFCGAMSSYSEGDNRALAGFLDELPDDFVLADTLAELRRVSGRGSGREGSARVQAALGTDSITISRLGRDLCDLLKRNGRPRTIIDLSNRLARALCPDDPVPALVDLITIAGIAAAQEHISPHTVSELAQRTLPPKRVLGVLARVDHALQQAELIAWNPAPAEILLSRLPTEFPFQTDHDLVRARVFDTLARTGRRSRRIYFLSPSMKKTVSKLLGHQPNEGLSLCADLMESSLAADPDNRDGYRFLIDLPGWGNEEKARKRNVLERMAAQFPEDAEPHVELTRLHFSSNAYRRAETSLGEARRRAPYDERILDMQATGFLNSSDRSRNRGRFELADRDIDRAAALNRSGLADIIAAKRILLEIVSSSGDAVAITAPHIERLAPSGQIRMLVLLIHDLDENSHLRTVLPEMAAGLRRMLAAKAAVIDGLDASEAAGLITPLARDLRVLYKSLNIAPILRHCWPAILIRLDGDQLLGAFDTLLECDNVSPVVRSEITRRLTRADEGERNRPLLLYLAVIRYQSGDDWNSKRFREALDGASPSERETLRGCAARMARQASGRLREALLSFNFDGLEYTDPDFFDPMAYDVFAEELANFI